MDIKAKAFIYSLLPESYFGWISQFATREESYAFTQPRESFLGLLNDLKKCHV